MASAPHSLFTALAEIVSLGFRTLELRLALARNEARLRVSAALTGAVLLGVAAILLLFALGMAAGAGLLGLHLLGLSPMAALLTGGGVCLVLALLLMLAARSLIRRALRPLSHTPGLGGGLPAAPQPAPL